MPQPDAALDMSQEAADAPEPPAAVEVSPEPESASTPLLTNESASSDDSAAELGPAAEPTSDPPDSTVPEAAAPPVAEGRAQVLAAFGRTRTPPSPQPAPPQPAPPQPRPAQRQAAPAERPWFSGREMPQPQEALSDEAVDELIAGWRAGNLAWPPRFLGGEPGNPDCRLSRETLRRNGLA
jgi:hypothetical protein